MLSFSPRSLHSSHTPLPGLPHPAPQNTQEHTPDQIRYVLKNLKSPEDKLLYIWSFFQVECMDVCLH